MKKVLGSIVLTLIMVFVVMSGAVAQAADTDLPDAFAMYRYDSVADEYSVVDYFAGESFDVFNGDIPFFGFVSSSSDLGVIEAYNPNFLSFPSDLNWAHWMGDNKTRNYSYQFADGTSSGLYAGIDYDMAYYRIQDGQAFWDIVTPNSFWMAAAELKEISTGNTVGYMSQFTVTPEPISSILFLVGGAGLVTRKFLK